MDKKFNPEKLDKLNNPARLEEIRPLYIREKLNLKICDTVVDIGAGTGLFSRAFAGLIDDGKVYAADISQVMVNWMEENITDSTARIIPLLMNESTVPLDDSIADLVLMINLHHELETPVDTLKESLRLLRTGGKVCIIDWKKEEMPYGPSFDIRCTTDDVKEQLETAGFSNVLIDNFLSKNFLIIAEKL